MFPGSPTAAYGAPRRVAAFLDELRDSLETLDLTERVEQLSVYRGRLVDNPTDLIPNAENLGPPPSKKAGASRLSAAGISVMYASQDAETAIAEIAGHGLENYACVGRFRATRALLILDLTKRPRVPFPVLDPTQWGTVQMAHFFEEFVAQVTRPIIPDGRHHIDYAPTQVLTEFLRWNPNPGRQPIDGIALPSSQTQHKTFVFFVDPGQVCDAERDQRRQPESVFEFHDADHYRVRRTYTGEILNRF